MFPKLLLSVYLSLSSFLAPSPMCTETTSAIRKLQPDSDLLPDSSLIYIAQYIDEASARFGVPMETLAVMTYGETRFDPTIPNLMQISRPWTEDLDGPMFCRSARKNQQASIYCGAYILEKCQKKFDGKNLYLCWSGFHIEDKIAFLERIKQRWMKLLG